MGLDLDVRLVLRLRVRAFDLEALILERIRPYIVYRAVVS